MQCVDVAPTGTFAWTPMPGATYYLLHRYLGANKMSGSPFSFNQTSTVLSHQAEATYIAKIQACNACGCSPIDWDQTLIYVAY